MNKTGDKNIRSIHDEVVGVLRALPRGADDETVFDTKNFTKEFKRACLKLKLFGARNTWECGQCHATDDKTSKKSAAPVCRGYDDEHKHPETKMRWGYVGFTIHGFRRSCVVYYRDRGISDAIIMKITGHSTLDVYNSYSAVALRTMHTAMKQAAQATPLLTA